MSTIETHQPLSLTGEMTVQVAADQKSLLSAALESSGSAAVLEIGLAGITELDTAGLQLLLLFKREAEHLGQSLRLMDPSDAVLEVLALARLDPQLEPLTLTALPQDVLTDPNPDAR